MTQNHGNDSHRGMTTTITEHPPPRMMTPPPPSFFHMNSRCHIAVSDVATKRRMAMHIAVHRSRLSGATSLAAM
ncbi:hypothetical protein K443DRAFT_14370 [Laccaria amethystina LaAM-08-1]|uniref:Uncharacterized protein n=1 Tax=Laccaria amethystina LaAM-08-1 TaxID=1095629 RepID=A0A0C9X1K0_9AGAR|nr:hypothetical protein K443DRAFT_14370 [Laccaria amethystina LaAM-08-1]